MIKVYANLVYNNVITLEDVPQKLRMAVEARVEEMRASS